VLQLTDANVAQLIRAVRGVSQRKRRRFLEDFAAKFDPTPAQLRNRARQRRYRDRLKLGDGMTPPIRYTGQGITNLIHLGYLPARVPDEIIAGIRAREVRGAVEIPKSSGLKPGDHVKILGGPFRGQLAFYAGMKSHQRVEVLLALLGSQQRVILTRADVEALAAG
jgi:hypothetical protein